MVEHRMAWIRRSRDRQPIYTHHIDSMRSIVRLCLTRTLILYVDRSTLLPNVDPILRPSLHTQNCKAVAEVVRCTRAYTC